MQYDECSTATAPKRPSWNKGKLIGPKPPLRTKHVWSIRTIPSGRRSNAAQRPGAW